METTPSTTRKTDAAALLAGLLLLGVWLAVHMQVVGFEFVNWDDDRFVLGVDSIREPAMASWRSLLLTPELGYPIPLTRAWFATLWAVFGWNAGAWHAAGLALHLGAVALFLALAYRLLGGWAKALLATALLLHPVGAEPVAWVAAQKDLLATLFALVGVLLAAGGANGSRTTPRASIVVVLLLLALASKPSVALFGLVAALAWGAPADDASRRTRIAIASIPTAFAVVSTLLTLRMQSGLNAVRDPADLSERIGLIASLTLSTAERIVWPMRLSPTYDVAAAPAFSAVFFVGLALTLLAMGALVWTSIRAQTPAMRVGAGWVLAAWLPVSGVAGALARGTSDSYVALMLPGLALLLVSAWPLMAQRASGSSPLRSKAPPLVALVLLLAVLAPLRAAALQPWRNSVALWEHAWERAGPLPWVCRNLGYAQVFSADGALPDTPEPYLRAHAIWSQCPERNERNLRRAEQVLQERWGLTPTSAATPQGGSAEDGSPAGEGSAGGGVR